MATSSLTGIPKDRLERIEATFLDKVARVPSGCWEWQRYIDNRGYGKMSVWSWGNVFAHRLAFEFFCGPIENGLCVLHACDNPACCNPTHLFLGTKTDNFNDMVQKGRQNFEGLIPHKRKVSTEIREAIKQEYRFGQTGHGRKVLAKKYGVSPSTIHRILNEAAV